MRTPNEVLVDYMYLKVETMYKVTKDPICFEFLTPDDIKELENWESTAADEVVSSISEIQDSDYYCYCYYDDDNDDNHDNDSDICPWCVYQNKSSCDSCGFGKRHGVCHVTGSLYNKFCTKYQTIRKVLAKDFFIEKATEIL